MKKISVIIIDDHPVIRHGVLSILKKQDDIVTLGESDSAHSGLALIKEVKPDVAILDISMTGISGIDLIPSIKQDSEKTVVIIYTMHNSSEHIYRAFKAGARGYVLKVDAIKDLLAAIRNTAKEAFYVSAGISTNIVNSILTGPSDNTPLSCLSQREYEVANLLSQGMTPETIGLTLFISPKTARVHRSNIQRKLNCSQPNELLLLLSEHFNQ